MKRMEFSAILALLLFVSTAVAEQRTGGLTLDFPTIFVEDTSTAAAWLNAASGEVRNLVKEMRVFVAPAAEGLDEARIMKVHYVAELQPSIDGGASESLKRVSALDGVENFRSSISKLTVSGLPARHASMSADRFGGKLGAEFLIVLDPSTNEMWQLQLIFGKKKGLNPFASLDMSEQQERARQVIRTVQVK